MVFSCSLHFSCLLPGVAKLPRPSRRIQSTTHVAKIVHFPRLKNTSLNVSTSNFTGTITKHQNRPLVSKEMVTDDHLSGDRRVKEGKLWAN